MKNNKIKLVVLTVLCMVGLAAGFFVVQKTRAESESLALFGEEDAKLIYSEKGQDSNVQKLMSLDYGFIKKDVQLKESQNALSQKVFLSPDRKYLAVTEEINPHEIFTYITDLEGKILVFARLGTFKSWSPDSKKVLLYLPIEISGKERQIYYLDLSGNYYDSGLPEGVINADISPIDGSIIYSLTDSRSDDSKIYLRSNHSADKLLVEGNKEILSWVRWSPDGKTFLFLKSDLGIRPDQQSVWIINSDETGLEKISDVDWGYPAVWSSDSQKIVFSDHGNILEYDIQRKEFKQVTNFTGKSFKHPSYSLDGQTIVFSDGQQIWSARNGIITQLTTSNQQKDYPVLP